MTNALEQELTWKIDSIPDSRIKIEFIFVKESSSVRIYLDRDQLNALIAHASNELDISEALYKLGLAQVKPSGPNYESHSSRKLN